MPIPHPKTFVDLIQSRQFKTEADKQQVLDDAKKYESFTTYEAEDGHYWINNSDERGGPFPTRSAAFGGRRNKERLVTLTELTA